MITNVMVKELREIPHFVTEEIKEECWSTVGTQTLAYEGGLAMDRLHKIKCIHIIHAAMEQVCWAKNLKRSPHYLLAKTLGKLFRRCCSERRIEIIECENTKSHINTGTSLDNQPFILVVNHGTEEFDQIRDLCDKLDLSPVCTLLDDVDVGNRGNMSATWGHSGQNTVRDPVNGVHTGKPKFVPIDEQKTRWMVALSNISCRLKLPFVQIMREQPQRLSNFAQRHHPENLFEAGARSKNVAGPDDKFGSDDKYITGVEKQHCDKKGVSPVADTTRHTSEITTCHVDQDNCSSPGFQWQAVASAVFRRDGRMTREFCAGHGCVGCCHYMLRSGRSSLIAQNIREHQARCQPGLRTLCKETFERESCPVEETLDWDENDQLTANRACSDKAAMHSYFIEVGERLADFDANYWRHTEASVCVGLVSTLDLHWIIFKTMRDRGNLTDGSSWLLTFISVMASRGGCHSGEIIRHVPHVNKDTTKEACVTTCVTVHKVVEHANGMAMPAHDRTEANKTKFQDLHYELCSMLSKNACIGIGELTGQHVLHFLIGRGIIKHPCLANYAKLATSTETWSRLCDGMGGMVPTKEQSKRLLRDVSSEAGTTQSVGESAICEMQKDTRRSTAFIDPMVGGQPLHKALTFSDKDGNDMCKFHCLRAESENWKTFTPVKLTKPSVIPVKGARDNLQWWKHASKDVKGI